jgi:hypothetical protein
MPFVIFEGDKDTTVPPINAEQLLEQWQVTDDWADDGASNGSVPRAPIEARGVHLLGLRPPRLGIRG